jgi:hypothetical protein
MTIGSAANYGNLPGGVWSPVIFSKNMQTRFRKKSVAQDITNSSYFGEIKGKGDTVRIMLEPEIVVRDYYRGTTLITQTLTDEDFQLVIDQSNYFQFGLDDLEAALTHIDWLEKASDRAGYKMADEMDINVLGYLSGYAYDPDAGTWSARTTYPGTKANSTAGSDELLSANKLTRASFVSGGSSSDSVAVGVSGTYDVTPLAVLNRMARRMDLQNVPKDGRWVVIDPVFKELLMDENSKFVNNDYAANQNAGGKIENGRLGNGLIRGFRVYESNNLPYIGTGPGTADTNGSSAHYGVIVAGHDSAVASAQQIDKVERFRNPTSFGEIVRGLNLYGRKILRPEAIVRVIWNSNVG